MEDKKKNRYGNNVIRMRCGKLGHRLMFVLALSNVKDVERKAMWPELALRNYLGSLFLHFFRLPIYGQGFHFIKSSSSEEGIKDMSNIALITITKGVVNAKQVEN